MSSGKRAMSTEVPAQPPHEDERVVVEEHDPVGDAGRGDQGRLACRVERWQVAVLRVERPTPMRRAEKARALLAAPAAATALLSGGRATDAVNHKPTHLLWFATPFVILCEWQICIK